jgi:hypothetical protein
MAVPGERPQFHPEAGIQVVPDQDGVAAGQLVMGGGQQVLVLLPGERPRLALAAAVLADAPDEPSTVAGPQQASPAAETELVRRADIGRSYYAGGRSFG